MSPLHMNRVWLGERVWDPGVVCRIWKVSWDLRNPLGGLCTIIVFSLTFRINKRRCSQHCESCMLGLLITHTSQTGCTGVEQLNLSLNI